MFKSIYIPRFVMSTSARSSLTWLLKSFLARSQSNAVIGKTKLAFSLVFETSVEVNNICQEYARKTLLRTQQTYDLLSLENSEISGQFSTCINRIDIPATSLPLFSTQLHLIVQ